MVVKALDAHGIDSDAALAECGIDMQMLTDPDFRVPVDSLGNLMQLAISRTGDPAFGLKVGTFICPTSFHALSMSMWLSVSLKEAFDRVVRYSQLLSDAGSSGLDELENEYCYWTELAGEDREFVELVDLAAMDALQSAMVTFCRSVSGSSFTPTRVSLMRNEPEDRTPYLEFFGCPVVFSQPRLSLSFDRETLTKPLASGHPELLKHSDHVIVESLNRFDKRDIVGRLRCRLVEQLPSGKPTQGDMASALHCSLRSLQRKLNERGVTYESVLSEVRREQGLKYIVQSHLSIADISYLLGFNSSTNFARTFKSWTGATPRAYRHQILANSPP